MATDLAALSFGRRVLLGMRYPLRGVKLVIGHPGLWGYLLAPAMITTSLFLLGTFVAWHGIGWILALFLTPGPEHATWVNLVWYTAAFSLRASAFVLTAVTLYLVSGLIAVPFNDRLSEHVETLCLGPYDEPFSWRVLAGDLLLSVAHSALSLTLWLMVMVASMALNLVPVIGQVLSFVVGTVATAFFLSREAMDGALSRRRMGYAHKLAVLRANGAVLLGFGLVASVMLWIPLLNFVLLPMAVAGGTLLYCRLETEGVVPDTQGRLGYTPERHRERALADRSLPAEPEG